MRGERNTNKNVRKFITVSDMNLWDKIDEIMTLPEYEKSFNRVINDVLYIGLPKSYASKFGTATEDAEPKPAPIEQDIIGDYLLNVVGVDKICPIC